MLTTHEDRAQRAGDALRAMMLALATAGIGAAYALREISDRGYWIGAPLCSIAALAAILRSWFLVKARELDRAAGTTQAAKRPPTGKWHARASWTWDTAAAWALVAGAAV